MSGYSFYSRLMTINMNGKAKPDERRALVSEIIKSEASSLVFCQELPGYFETDVVPNDYKFVETIVKTKRKHAAVMWSKQHFHRKPVDAESIKKISDALVKLKKIDDEIPSRTALVRLTAKGEEAFNFPKPPFLAVSWHGPYSGKKGWTLEKKQKALKGLILFLHEVCRRCAEDVSLIIIGGDFNLNTLDENGLGWNVYFPRYKLSDRAAAKLEKNRKKKGRPYIPYKDNFAITTTSPSVVSPFKGMNLSTVKAVEEESEKGKLNILDHDPIIGDLQLGKTSSTGIVECFFELLRQAKKESKSLAEHKRQLEKNVKRSGLKIRSEIPEDGNCLFHAVADQLKRLGVKEFDHSNLRELAVETLRNEDCGFTKDELHGFLPGDVKDLEEYLEKMSKDGEWGDHIVLLAMARALGQKIRVVTSSLDQYELDDVPQGQSELLLGLINEHHYVSLEPEDVQDLPPRSWERDAFVTTEGPLTKNGKPDMRFKVNKEAYGQSPFQNNTKAFHGESEQPLTKSGKPDMRFKVNKEAYGQSSFQKSYSSRSSSSESSSDGSSSCEFDASVTTEGPLTKNGKPDMRFKVNKEAYGQSYFQKSTEDSHGESERPLTKSGKPDMRFKVNKEAYGQSSFQKSTEDSHSESERPLTKSGKPDMRFKVNKEAYGQSSFQKSYSSRSSSSESSFDGSSSCEFDASVTTEGPLTKNGKPDMRFRVNKETYGQSYFQKSTEDSHSESERPLTKSGKPDMRFKVNKEAYGQSSFQKSYSSRSSSSESSSDRSSSCEFDASVTTEGPLTKNGKPDMLFEVNKQADGQSSFQKSTEDSHSESERTLALFSDVPACSWERDARKPASPAQTSRSAVTSSSCEGPLKKDGTPDTRFASNKQSASSMSSLPSYSSASGPIKKDGTPDMRSAANKSSYDDPSSSGYWSGGSFYSTGLLASLASPGPLKSDGTPDMRCGANKSSNAIPYSYGGSTYSSVSSSTDGTPGGTPDMRSAANKSDYDGLSSSGYLSGGSFYSTELLASLASPGSLKSDGTPDMRYAADRSSNASPYSYGGSTYSSVSSSTDGTPGSTPDIRYAANKPYYDGLSSSGYLSGGSFYSTELLASLASPGPLKSDGTPDMRYAADRSSNASPYSYGGSTYSSVSSSTDGTPGGTPDIRYAANKPYYDGLSSSGYWSGGSFYSTELLASLASPGSLKSDGTPDMRYAANRSSNASPYSYGGSTYSYGSSSCESSFDGSSSCGPLKSDGTPDMRYAVNKALYGSSSLYGGSTCSSRPLKKDGTPDMRYAVNKASYGSSSSYGGSTCSSRPLKKDGTPDMRYAVNKDLYGSSSSYGGSTCSSRSSSRRSGSRGPLKKDGTPDMRFKANRR